MRGLLVGVMVLGITGVVQAGDETVPAREPVSICAQAPLAKDAVVSPEVAAAYSAATKTAGTPTVEDLNQYCAEQATKAPEAK